MNESNEVAAPYDVALSLNKTIKKGSKCTVNDITSGKEKQAGMTKLEIVSDAGKTVLVFDNDDDDIKLWLNESAVAYKIPRSAFANPWLTHKIQSASWIRPYEFGNAFNDGIVNAEVACAGCVAEEGSIETATNIKAVYVNESNEICFAPAVPAYISENGQINSADEFKEYAKVVLKEAHGDDYDESIADKTISGLLDKYDNNYGAMVGALTSGFGANESAVSIDINSESYKLCKAAYDEFSSLINPAKAYITDLVYDNKYYNDYSYHFHLVSYKTNSKVLILVYDTIDGIKVSNNKLEYLYSINSSVSMFAKKTQSLLNAIKSKQKSLFNK
jgi:hypothetical protein